MSKVQIDIGKCFTTKTVDGETVVLSFSGTCGYILQDDTFQLIYIHGSRGEKYLRTQKLDSELKSFFK